MVFLKALLKSQSGHDTELVAVMVNQHLKIETSIEIGAALGKKDSTKQQLLKISIPSLAVKN